MADRKTPVIDCHAHVKWYGYDATRLVQNMDQHGIDVMWLLSWEAPDHEIPPHDCFWPGRRGLPFVDVVEAVDQYPDRFVPFFAPDPRQPEAMERLRAGVQHHGVRGVGEMKCRIMLDDPGALHMWHYAGEHDLPVIFHLDTAYDHGDLSRSPGYWYCCTWENLARAMELCPKTKFLGHAPGFWAGISGDAEQRTEPYPSTPIVPGGKVWEFLDAFPNLHCDLSAGSALNALTRDPAVGREFLMKYSDRCLFGRDYFDDRLHQYLLSLELPEDVMAAIMGGNALRLVPLD